MYILNINLKRGIKMDLKPHEHFCVVYNARIEETQNQIIVGMNIPPHLPQGVTNLIKTNYKTEKEIAIYMGESKFKTFLENHMRMVDIFHNIVDSRVREQFEKLMILINLTK